MDGLKGWVLGLLSGCGILFLLIIVLGWTGILDTSDPMQETRHAVTVETHHFGTRKWIHIWSIDNHVFIQHNDGFFHSPTCKMEVKP